jgi:hypothetical protein
MSLSSMALSLYSGLRLQNRAKTHKTQSHKAELIHPMLVFPIMELAITFVTPRALYATRYELFGEGKTYR